MLDNSGPIARTMAAPYPIIDCEKMSASGLTCNSVSAQHASRPARAAGSPVSKASPSRPLAICPDASRFRKLHAAQLRAGWSPVELHSLRLGGADAPAWGGLHAVAGCCERKAVLAHAIARRRAARLAWCCAYTLNANNDPCGLAHAAPAFDGGDTDRADESVRLQVINSNMEPPGNNNCEGFQMADHGFEVTDSPARCLLLALPLSD